MSTYYVATSGSDSNAGTSSAPFATPAHALSVLADGDTIVFHAGTYYLAAAITLAHNNITLQTAGDGQVTLSGGLRVTGWAVYSGNIWRADLNPAALANGTTRNLFVNGVRAKRSRARWGGAGTSAGTSTITTTNSYLDGAKNPTAIELLWRIQSTGAGGTSDVVRWREPRCPVASVSGDTITPAATGWALIRVLNNTMGDSNVPTHVENCWEIFSTNLRRGTFYYDPSGAVSGTAGIYYIPRAGENPAAAAMIVSNLEQLLTGDSITGLTMQGSAGSELIFADTQWLQAGTTSGHAELGQLTYLPDGSTSNPRDMKSTKPKEALSFTRASSATFSRCQFRRMSTTCAGFADQSHDITIEGCAFVDVGGNWLQLGDTAEINPATPTHTVNVHDCLIDRFGQEFSGASGLLSFYVLSPTFQNNEIYNGPYSGVALGWGLGIPRSLMAGFNFGNYPSISPSSTNSGGSAIELGTQFELSVDAFCVGIGFWAADSGTYVLNLWDNSGNLLESVSKAVTLSGGTAAWQVAYFNSGASPASFPSYLAASTTYRVSMSTPTNVWSYTDHYFDSSVTYDIFTGLNGCTNSTPGSFPNADAFNNRNYFVTPVVSNANAQVQFLNNIVKNTVTEMADGGGIYIQGLQSCGRDMNVFGRRIDGNGMSDGGAGEIETGVAFQVSQDCQVTGVRYYRLAAASGAATAHVWDGSGNKLANIEFSGESASGWQECFFSTDNYVDVPANTTFTASVSLPSGHFASSNSTLTGSQDFSAGPKSRGPITLLAGHYGTFATFPTTTVNSANYWVEPIISLNTSRSSITGNVVGNVDGPGIYADQGTARVDVLANVLYSTSFNINTNIVQPDPSDMLNYDGNYVQSGTDGDAGANPNTSSDPRTAGASVLSAAGITSGYSDVKALAPRQWSRLFRNSTDRIAGAVSGLVDASGSVSLWVRPNFDGNDGYAHVLLDMVKSTSRFQIIKDTDGKLYAGFILTDGSNDQRVSATTDPAWWQAGQWFQVKYTWTASGSTLTVGGVVVATGGSLTTTDVNDSLCIGNLVAGGDDINFDGAISNVAFAGSSAFKVWPLSEDGASLMDTAGSTALTASATANSLVGSAPTLLSDARGRGRGTLRNRGRLG